MNNQRSDERDPTINPITRTVVSQGQYSVAGVIVHCHGVEERRVASRIEALDGAEVHAMQDGKLVVTVEASNGDKTLIDCIAEINQITGVINTALVYSETEYPE